MTRDHDDLRATLEFRSTEELASILRDRDADEWRPEVFDLVERILRERGISTADVVVSSAAGAHDGERPMVTVARFMRPVEAHAARQVLESAGIEAWVYDTALGSIGTGCRLQVGNDDEAAALEILEGDSSPLDPRSPDLAEPPCPRCGSAKVRPIAEHADPERPQFVRLGTRVLRKWWYDCAACGHRWPDDDA